MQVDVVEEIYSLRPIRRIDFTFKFGAVHSTSTNGFRLFDLWVTELPFLPSHVIAFTFSLQIMLDIEKPQLL